MLSVQEKAICAQCNGNIFQLQLSCADVSSPYCGQSESNESYITFNMASFLRTKEICVKYVIWITFALLFLSASIYALASSYTPQPCKKVSMVNNFKREETDFLGLI